MKRRYSTILCLLVIVVSLTFALRTKDNMSNAQTQQTPVAFDLETLRESIGVFLENMSDPNKGGSKAVEDFLKNSSLADNEKIKTKFSDGIVASLEGLGRATAVDIQLCGSTGKRRFGKALWKLMDGSREVVPFKIDDGRNQKCRCGITLLEIG